MILISEFMNLEIRITSIGLYARLTGFHFENPLIIQVRVVKEESQSLADPGGVPGARHSPPPRVPILSL